MLHSNKHHKIINAKRMEQIDNTTPNFDTSRFTMLPRSRVELNDGQLPGLPKNPREIRKKAFEKLKNDIAAYPEMILWRCLLVYPLDDAGERYIIIGGNMRYLALSELNVTDVPCIVIPRETPVERLQAYTILDNGDFGKWDWDLLANEWSEDDLSNWGIDLPTEWSLNPENCGDDFSLPDKDKEGVQHMGFILSAQQAETIKSAIERVRNDGSADVEEYDGNTNKNGNALFIIVQQWEEQKRLS